MIVTTRGNLEQEIWKDLFIVMLAMLLTALLATICHGQEMSEPARLPPEMILAARAMPTEATREDAYMKEAMQSAVPVDPRPMLADELPQRVWRALNLHRAGQPARAIEAWNQVALTSENEVWRQVAIAHAWLAQGRLEEAEVSLARATELAPNNAVAWYLTGLLHLRQAATAREWYDAEGPAQFRLVSTADPKVAPNSRGMYLLAAAAAFHKAVDAAEAVDFDAPLVMHSPRASMAAPTVGDLLVAIGAERFEARSHLYLGRLCMKRHLPEAAEKEFDAARKLGELVAPEYRALARVYREEENTSAAFRAHLKSAMQSPSVLPSIREAYRDLEGGM